MQIGDVVNVQITRENARITQEGFGTALIFGIHTSFVEDYRVYTDLEAVAVDFLTSTEEYKAAAKYFSQALSPERLVIGKRAANVAQQNLITVATVANTTLYTVTINGVAFNYTSDASATNLEIAAGLVAAVNAGSEPVTATDNTDGTFDLDADEAGVAFTVAVTANLTNAAVIANVSLLTELTDFYSTYKDWYFLLITRRTTEAEQLLDIGQAADFIEAVNPGKLFFTSIDQSSLLTSATTDIASVLKGLTYERTTVLYSADEENYPEASWVGGQAPKEPYGITWKFKELTGNVVDNLTDNSISNLDTKNANYFLSVGGTNRIMSKATVASGEFIDVMWGSDKLTARISERIFTRLINADKVPFTSKGLSAIEGDIYAEMLIAAEAGFIVKDSIKITMPAITAISSADKAARHLQGVTFEAQLQGAIHKTTIRGKLYD